MNRLVLVFISCVTFGASLHAGDANSDFPVDSFIKGCAKGAVTTTVGTVCGVLSAFGLDSAASGLKRAAKAKLIRRSSKLGAVPRLLKGVEHKSMIGFGTCIGLLYNFVVGGKDLIACLDNESDITPSIKAYAAGRLTGSLTVAGLTAAVLACCPITSIGK